MIETNPDERPAPARRFAYGVEFGRPPRAWLLDEHMFPVRCRRLRDFRQQIVSGADNHNIDILSRNSGLPIRADGGARSLRG